MAKKKGRRTTNVARKREKRNRDRKFRQKQLALEKQRRLPHGKSEEDYLHACISQSRELLAEPEFEGVHFDPILMHKRVMEVLDQDQDETEPPEAPTDISEYPLASETDAIYPIDVSMDKAVVAADASISIPAAEEACEHFRMEVLPHLVTPDFMQKLTQALTACETRLKRTGNRELAEVAFVTRSIFGAAPPEILTSHPMIQAIGIETLRVLVEEMDVIIDGREEVKEILSDVMAQEDAETYPSQPLSVFSNTGLDEVQHENDEFESDAGESVSHATEIDVAEEVDIEDGLEILTETGTSPPTEPVASSDPEPIVLPETAAAAVAPLPPIVSPDELPARALYKNFNGLAIKERFVGVADNVPLQEGFTNYTLVNENETQVEFADVENERYITVTEEKLQLHARSEAELAIAMAELEGRCPSAVMYLAKTVEERG